MFLTQSSLKVVLEFSGDLRQLLFNNIRTQLCGKSEASIEITHSKT